MWKYITKMANIVLHMTNTLKIPKYLTRMVKSMTVWCSYLKVSEEYLLTGNAHLILILKLILTKSVCVHIHK